MICPYGRLYNKEAAIEALLQRRRHQVQGEDQLHKKHDRQNHPVEGDCNDKIGKHVRGLKDLYDVHFQTLIKDDGTIVPVCPVTRRELNGKVTAFALVPKTNKKYSKKGAVASTKNTVNRISRFNVVAEKAIQQLGLESILSDYGPDNTSNADEKYSGKDVLLIRLCPPPEVLKDVQNKLKEQRQQQEDDDKIHNEKKKDSRKAKKNSRRDDPKVENESFSSESIKKLKSSL